MGLAVSLLLKNFGVFESSLNIALFGPRGAGKTALLERWKHASHQPVCAETPVSDGCAVTHLHVHGVSLSVWEISEHVQDTWMARLGSVAAIVYVVDGSDAGSITKARAALARVIATPALPATTPLLLCIAKQDLAAASAVTRPSASRHSVAESLSFSASGSEGIGDGCGVDELSSLLDTAAACTRPWHVQPVSAVAGTGVTSAMTWLCAQLADGGVVGAGVAKKRS